LHAKLLSSTLISEYRAKKFWACVIKRQSVVACVDRHRLKQGIARAVVEVLQSPD